MWAYVDQSQKKFDKFLRTIDLQKYLKFLHMIYITLK